MRPRRPLAVLALALVIGGCGPPPGPPTAPSGTAGASLIAISDPALVHAIEMRRSAGLRFDIAFVLAAASDPRATISYLDIPLYPEEETRLQADQGIQDEAIGVLQRYAAERANEDGGLYIDRDLHPGIVTSLWTGDVEAHRTALLARGASVIILREVRYPEAYLRSVQDRVTGDIDWMNQIPAAAESIGVDIIRNVATVTVSSAQPGAVEQIKAHYGLGDELEVISDGIGVRFIPWGTVKGFVVTRDGAPVRQNELILDWTSPAAGSCGGGDIGYGVTGDGHFEIPCQVGPRTIIVEKLAQDGTWREIGRGTVTVTAATTVNLTIHLTEAP